MKTSDIQHLTESQIRNLFSIPPGNPIPKVSYVDVPAGIKLHGGAANGLYDFDGGGYQFFIDISVLPDNQVPENWFFGETPIENFLN